MHQNRKDFYKKMLLHKLKELNSAIGKKREEGITGFESAEPDMYDFCVQSYSKEQVYSLCERDREVLTKVEAALEKLNGNSYGICQDCEEPIGEKRLEAIPWVDLCVVCQTKKERNLAA